MATQVPPAPEANARLKKEVDDLQQEVLRLQRKLGDLHAGDFNALQRAYTSLCQHVDALEQEARGMVADLQEFETQMVPPELVAHELGVAAGVAFGVALLHQTIRVLPLKPAAAPLIAKGLWLLGGAFVLARLTTGTLAHIVGMFGRNAAKKRRLLHKLEAVQERISIMAALQQWAEKQAATAAGEASAASPGEAGAGEAAAAPEGVPPPRKVSPATSSSSAEMVEMPQVEELEAAEAGMAAGRAARPHGPTRQPARAAAAEAAAEAAEQQAGRPDPVLQSLRAYAELGSKR